MSRKAELSDSLRAIDLVANHYRFTPKLVMSGLYRNTSLRYSPERVERLLDLLERRGFLMELGLRVPSASKVYSATSKGRLAIAGARLRAGVSELERG